MALTDIIDRVRAISYGPAIGEKPPIRVAATNANESVSNGLVTFSVNTGEGAKIPVSSVLSTRGASSESGSYVLYVVSKSTDSITAVNGYEGPLVGGSDSGDLDNMLFEQNANPTEYTIFQHIKQVMNTLIYPHLVKLSQRTLAPNLATYQNEIPSEVLEIKSAWQVIADEAVQIPFELDKNLGVGLSSTSSLAYLGAIDGTTVTLVTEEKYTTSDVLPPALEQCVATGAAALALGATVSEAQMASASKDSQNRQPSTAAATLWRDFITLRTSLAEEQALEFDYFEIKR